LSSGGGAWDNAAMPARALVAAALALAPIAARAGSPAESKGFDLVALDYTATLAPPDTTATGALDVSLRVASVEPAAALGLVLDAGLEVVSASAPGYSVALDEVRAEPLSTVTLTLTPAPPRGAELVVHVELAGRLACEVSDLRGHRACSFAAPMGHLRRGSILPDVYDPADGAATYELYRRSLRLDLPEGVAAIASGDVVSEVTVDGVVTRAWASDVVHNVQDLVVVFGDLDALDVPLGAQDAPLRLWFAVGDEDWTQEMRGWAAAAMPFLTRLAGGGLPFAEVALVEVPRIEGFDGTATANMVLLSESYAGLGAGYFEQTLAHELSHLWWGNVAFADERGYWLLEGLARFSELEYMAARYPYDAPAFAPGDGSARSRWHANLMRYVLAGDGLVPLVLAGATQPPGSSQLQFSAWAYARGAATLDHLRVVVGADAFAAGLARWAADCAFSRCTSRDFQTLMEEESSEDLDAFFAQHVFGTTFPSVSWTFQDAPSADGVEVTLTYTQDPPAASTLELWLEHEDGAVEARLVELTGASGALTLAAAAPVRRVSPNPYHDPIIWTRSAVDGDVDFDRAVDGVDLVRCAEWVTLGFPAVPSAQSLFDVNPIDFRCDLDLDGDVDRDDLELMALAFGQLEPGAGGAP